MLINMDRSKTKSSRTPFGIFAKKTNTKRSQRTQNAAGTNVVTIPYPLEKNDIVKCRYCTKLFYYPEYAMKHVLKRHSDSVGEYLPHDPKSDEQKIAFQEFNVNISEVQKVVQKLQSEMEKQLKIVKTYQHSHESSSSDNTYNSHKSTVLKKDIHTQEQEQKNIKELDVLKARCENFETNVQQLDAKYKQIIESLQHTSYFKENIIENTKGNQRVQSELKAFKNELLNLKSNMELNISNIKDIFSHEMNQQKLELEEQFLQFHKKQTYVLEASLDSRLRDLNMKTDSNIEELFEYHLQNYLKSLCSKQDKKVPPASEEKVFNKKKLKRNLPAPTDGKQSKNTLITNPTQMSLSEQIDAQLKKFGIFSNESITDYEFQSKYRLIKNESRKFSARYKNFNSARKKLEQLADIETRKLLISSSVKRSITFADDKPTPISILKKNTGTISKVRSTTPLKCIKTPVSSEFIISKDPEANCSPFMKIDFLKSHSINRGESCLDTINADNEDEASEISLEDIGDIDDLNIIESQPLEELSPSNRFETIYSKLGTLNKMLRSETNLSEIKLTSANNSNVLMQTFSLETDGLKDVEEQSTGRGSNLSLETLDDFDIDE